ncbi:hypothetical protein FNU76_05600 [Chitinimonas arctica]|uniref:Uncharacterized protein n=1 Tax=Chitinimonas arctica TaxID=2594795 RepID=A0A516SCI9_9NEIS|nr:hypothetical protein [Chitinimonas arctica]QDQ25865.1 hypothetical protein FNU76_05600 [Chitinimonas arctica]
MPPPGPPELLAPLPRLTPEFGELVRVLLLLAASVEPAELLTGGTKLGRELPPADDSEGCGPGELLRPREPPPPKPTPPMLDTPGPPEPGLEAALA